MKLLYSISAALLLFFLLLPLSSPRSLEKRIRSLEANVSNLKHEVDDLLVYFKTCNSTANETVFRGFVTSYLQNQTSNGGSSRNGTDDLSFLQKLKLKIKKLLNFSKSPNFDDTYRFSRSSADDDYGGDSSGCADLKRHLAKFVNCLDVEDGSSGSNETTVEVVEEEILTAIETTTPKSQKDLEDAAEKKKVDTALSFMGHLKHPVEMIGKPQFKRPDMKKIEEQIENAKSAGWMQVDDMETTTMPPPSFHITEDPLEFFDLPNIAVIKRNADGDCECESGCGKSANSKVKRNDLFKGLLEPIKEPVQYEVPNEIVSGQQSEDESTIISNEVNKLASKIDLKQQMELISFHDQLDEKPRRFDFDVEPFYQRALANITKPGNKLQESKSEDDGILLGAHKFFDFEADKRKRSSKDGRVERLKQNLISEYKDHQFRAGNFEKMVKQVHSDHVDRNEYKFLDETYHLNDGSTHADEIIRPLNIVNKLKSPNEIKMEMELGERFKELENYESDARETGKNDDGAEEAPFYKTENVEDGSDLEELAP